MQERIESNVGCTVIIRFLTTSNGKAAQKKVFAARPPAIKGVKDAGKFQSFSSAV
jgi:hypothetical protein